MASKFENLNVWNKALELSDIVYELTKVFPIEEMYGLTSQVRWTANSVSLDIAEGSTGQSTPELNVSSPSR